MRRSILLVAAGLSIAGVVPAMAGDTVPAGRGPAVGSGLPAAGERSLPSDPVLRREMAAIRQATLDVHTLVTHRRMPPDMATRYAVTVTGRIHDIRAVTTRPADVVRELEPLLSSLALGAEAVAGRGGELDPISGILSVGEALELYGRRFDDPQWQPLR